jgi:hypothetical protein
MRTTDYQAKYFAYDLTRRCAPDSAERVAGAVAGAQVDLNPHQVNAALFAFAIQYGFTPASRLRFPKNSTEKSWSDDLISLEEIGAGLKTLEL